MIALYVFDAGLMAAVKPLLGGAGSTSFVPRPQTRIARLLAGWASNCCLMGWYFDTMLAGVSD